MIISANISIKITWFSESYRRKSWGQNFRLIVWNWDGPIVDCFPVSTLTSNSQSTKATSSKIRPTFMNNVPKFRLKSVKQLLLSINTKGIILIYIQSSFELLLYRHLYPLLDCTDQLQPQTNHHNWYQFGKVRAIHLWLLHIHCKQISLSNPEKLLFRNHKVTRIVW